MGTTTAQNTKIVSREEWPAARWQLLVEEKESRRGSSRPHCRCGRI